MTSGQVNERELIEFIFIMIAIVFFLYSKWTRPWVEKHLMQRTSWDDYINAEALKRNTGVLIFCLLGAALA